MERHRRCGFVGFAHPHGWAIWNRLKQEPGFDVVAVCEEDASIRGQLKGRADMPVVHDSLDRFFAGLDLDVVATASVYGRRGDVIVQALRRGCHVLADKPICTSLDEVDSIADLCGRSGLVLGCELDLRGVAQLQQARELIRDGTVGEIHAVHFGGQHPTFCYQRADWYLDSRLYGGVINDIGIHAVDAIQWLTGMALTEVAAARNWTAFRRGGSPFQDAAQMLLVMENGGGVTGDVSFVSPDSFRFSLPYYWEFTFWGTKGVLRCALNRQSLDLHVEGEETPRQVQAGSASAPDYFAQFVNELDGTPGDLTTQTILEATRKTLLIQHAADHDFCRQSLV